MKTNVKAIPQGFSSLTPYLNIKNAEKAIEYYKKAFGAKEVGRITMPDGTIGHAELEIGNSKLMLAEEMESWGNKSPLTLGGSPLPLCLYVEDVDKIFERAIKEGGKAKRGMEVKDEFYGDRVGALIDPFGHEWFIMTHIEDLTFEEMQSRSDALLAATEKHS